MSVELFFTELLLMFCVIVLLFRCKRKLPGLLHRAKRHLRSMDGENGTGDFYCFFHSRVLTGR